MKTTTIESYLTQQKLKIILENNFKILNEEFRVENTRMHWDFLCEINNQICVVEFDGDLHYRDSLLIMRDRKKDTIAAKLNYKTIRIPYWVQLNNVTSKFFFGIECNIKQDFNHGFIKTKVFPASFCQLGLERFENEYLKYPNEIQLQTQQSLRDRINEYGEEFVITSGLKNILNL